MRFIFWQLCPQSKTLFDL